MQSKREAIRLKGIGITKSNIEVPHLKRSGIGKRFLMFVEIARHPEGLSIGEISIKCDCGGRTAAWYHINALLKEALVTCTYEKRNGKVEAVFRITPYGIDMVQKEMRGICEIISEVKKELISSEPIRKARSH